LTTPESLTFGSFSKSLTIELDVSDNGDSGTITAAVDTVRLSIEANDVDNSGIGSYTLSVGRSDLSPGICSH